MNKKAHKITNLIYFITENCYSVSKKEVPRDVRNWKSENMTSSLNIVPNGTGPLTEGVSVLCWLAAPVARFYGNLRNLVIRSKSVIRSRSVISSQIGVMSYLLRVSLYMAMAQNVMYHLGEGDFRMFNEIPISTIKLPEGRFQTFPDIYLSEELRWKSSRP